MIIGHNNRPFTLLAQKTMRRTRQTQQIECNNSSKSTTMNCCWKKPQRPQQQQRQRTTPTGKMMGMGMMQMPLMIRRISTISIWPQIKRRFFSSSSSSSTSTSSLEEAKEMSEENNQQQNNNHTNNHHNNNNHLNLISNYQQQRKMINLTSDNWTGAHPAITEALLHHSAGGAKAYGESDLDKKIEEKFVQIFERKKVAVYFVGTGTASNALAMAHVNRPGGIIFAHKHAHMIEDECGAPEYITGGARMFGVGGAHGKIDPNELEDAIQLYPAEFVHAGQPMAVSLTQSTESGTVYTLEQIQQIARIAHGHGLPLHMDGARFANALCALGCTPAEMSWKSGVDILSFGATKNGCWCAEAIIVFNDVQKAERDFPFLRKRAAHLFSKTRFIAAQFEAYFHNDLWLQNARHANKMASRLAEIIQSTNNNSIRMAWDVNANELFVVMQCQVAQQLKETGRISPFYQWKMPDRERKELKLAHDEALYRLVTTFATEQEEVDQFGQILAMIC